MVDDASIAAIGAVIVGFGIAAFVFRVQRELQLPRADRWIPWADRLLIGVVTVTLVLVLFPVALGGRGSGLWGGRLPAAACCASTIALAGYIPALLAHYRGSAPIRRASGIWFGAETDPRRAAAEPAEKAIVIASVVLGVMAAVASFVVTG